MHFFNFPEVSMEDAEGGRLSMKVLLEGMKDMKMITTFPSPSM
jgi:hypothetical protein